MVDTRRNQSRIAAPLDPERDWETLLAASAASAFLGSMAEAVERALSGEGPQANSPTEAEAPADDELSDERWVFLDVRRHPPTLGRCVIMGDPTIGCRRCGRVEPFGGPPVLGGSPVLIANGGDAPSGWDERTNDEWDEAITHDILAGHAAPICRDCLTADDLAAVDREWFGRFLKSIGWEVD